MNKANIVLPHRLLLNQSLRKEAEKLRVHIDEYQRGYDAQYKKNIAELEATRDRLNIEYEQAQKTILENLSSEAETIQAISDAITLYVSTYFDRQLSYKKKENNAVQKRIVNEYVDFLSEQMSEIGLEIDMLRERSEMLSLEADVSDITHLVQLSGSALPVEEINNAKDLLEIVNSKMDELLESDNEIEWKTLRNVRIILGERVSFLAEIQYISWVIEQKIQLSKELKICRDEQIKLQRILLTEAEVLQREIDSFNSILWDTAKKIRFYWAKPMVFIGAEIEDNLLRIKQLKGEITDQSEKKKSLYNDKENVQHKIDRMKDEHSSDSFKWERLQREKRGLADEIKDLKSRISNSVSEIESLESEIDALKSKRSNWNAKRKYIQQLLRTNAAPLIRIGTDNQTDDVVYVEIRIKELELIEAEGMKAAKEIYKTELERLIAEKDIYKREQEAILSEIAARLDEANKQLQIATEQLESRKSAALDMAKANVAKTEKLLADQRKMVTSLKNKLTDIQSADSRFILARWFSDTPEETKAKAAVISAQKKMASIQAELDATKRNISSNSFADIPDVAAAQKLSDDAKTNVDHVSAEMDNARMAYNDRIAEYDKKIKLLKPHPERPTPEERSEMNRIRTWKASRTTRSGKKEKRL